MRFSIIVPVYNSELFLDTCISSVLNQSFADWELVAVDDGSSDKSFEMLEKYSAADKRICVIRQENMGQFFARQSGINSAKGEYILFLDSDDELEPHCLETIENELSNSDADILIYTATAVCSDGKEPIQIAKLYPQKTCLNNYKVKERLISGALLNSMCLKAFRRSLFLGDDTDYTAFSGQHFGEDKVQLLYPLTNAGSICYIPDALYRYNYRRDSVMHSYRLEKARLMMAEEMFSMLLKYMKRWGMDDEKHMAAYWAQYLRNFISVYYNIRKKCKMCGSYAEFRSYPWQELPQNAALKSSGRKLLTAKEKLKLIQALKLKR